MGKKIEYYLHLYDCDCIVQAIDGNEGWRYNSKDIQVEKNTTVKLVLRPLSDILNTEAYEVYKMYFGQEYAKDWSGDNGSVYFKPKKRRIVSGDAIRIFDGLDYETGDFMTVCKIVPYLLKQGFDLFGLIESGLAIDKTSLTDKNLK